VKGRVRDREIHVDEMKKHEERLNKRKMEIQQIDETIGC
jgi:hypothetical protein